MLISAIIFIKYFNQNVILVFDDDLVELRTNVTQNFALGLGEREREEREREREMQRLRLFIEASDLELQHPTLRNCFVDVSDRIGDALGLRYSGECLRVVSSSNRTSYLMWSDDEAMTPLRLSTELAKCLALKDGEVVRVSKAFGVSEAKNVEIEPVSSDDWEMIELNGGHLEQNLLGQISLVWSNAVLPIWIKNACVRIRVKTNSGDRPLRLTRDVTQLLVVPKPRDKIEDVKGGEDEEFEDPIVNARVTMHRADPMDRVIRISSLVADAMKLKRHELNDVVVAVWPRRRRKKKKIWARGRKKRKRKIFIYWISCVL